MFKRKKIVETGGGFSHPLGEDYPEVPPTSQGETVTLPIRFYTQKYSISEEDKVKLCELVARPEFRTFEKYIDWRVNAAAHRMVAAEDDERAGEIRAEIRALVKIGNDMRAYWQQVKVGADTDEIEMKSNNNIKATAFGDAGISVSFANETV